MSRCSVTGVVVCCSIRCFNCSIVVCNIKNFQYKKKILCEKKKCCIGMKCDGDTTYVGRQVIDLELTLITHCTNLEGNGRRIIWLFSGEIIIVGGGW